MLIAGFDGSARLMEEEDSACPALLEQDFNRYQRSVPGLRRSGVDANAIRQVKTFIFHLFFKALFIYIILFFLFYPFSLLYSIFIQMEVK